MGNAQNKTILVIDDDKDMMEAIRIMLETEGFTVESAGSGKEGLEKATSRCPDLILVDMMMETVDAGARVAEQIKNSGCQAPMILLSSIGDATSYNLDISAIGLSGAIQKPVKPGVLIPLIRRKLKIED